MTENNIISPEWFPISNEDLGPGNETGITIRNIPLFSKLKQRDWSEISSFFHERHYKTNETIFEYGTPGLGMYIVMSGSVKIIGPPSDEELVFAELHAGDFFGEMSLIDFIERSATAVAREETVLVGIFRPQLEKLLKRRPKLGILIISRLAKIISHRLRQTNLLLREYKIHSRVRSE